MTFRSNERENATGGPNGPPVSFSVDGDDICTVRLFCRDCGSETQIVTQLNSMESAALRTMLQLGRNPVPKEIVVLCPVCLQSYAEEN